jgi:hypothetical protein
MPLLVPLVAGLWRRSKGGNIAADSTAWSVQTTRGKNARHATVARRVCPGQAAPSVRCCCAVTDLMHTDFEDQQDLKQITVEGRLLSINRLRRCERFVRAAVDSRAAHWAPFDGESAGTV